MTKNLNPEFMTIEETAEFLRISERILREMVSNREIPHNQLGSTVLFKRESLLNWMKENERPPEPKEKINAKIIPDCNQDKVNTLIQEFTGKDENFVKGLGENLKADLEKFEYKKLSDKVFCQLSRWCWPHRHSVREQWVQPKAQEISKLLFGKVIKRTKHSSYKE